MRLARYRPRLPLEGQAGHPVEVVRFNPAETDAPGLKARAPGDAHRAQQQLDPALPSPAVVPQREVWSAPAITLGAAVHAFQKALGRFTSVGLPEGDPDFSRFWSRTHQDYAAPIAALGQALEEMASSTAQSETRGELETAARRLTDTSAAGGQGDDSYWHDRVIELLKETRGALAGLARQAQASGGTVEAHAVLRALAGMGAALPSCGRGDSEYWLKATDDASGLGRGIGEAVEVLVLELEPGQRARALELARALTSVRGEVADWEQDQPAEAERVRKEVVSLSSALAGRWRAGLGGRARAPAARPPRPGPRGRARRPPPPPGAPPGSRGQS
ncbi:MAG: hypothetical protein IPJ65_06590 [Archangiaceae bacterium]|nr:hypothetical protein [Archangiaceae bacterium]